MLYLGTDFVSVLGDRRNFLCFCLKSVHRILCVSATTPLSNQRREIGSDHHSRSRGAGVQMEEQSASINI
jgi:hypothetical protein